MSGKATAHSPAWSEKDAPGDVRLHGRLNNDLAETGELVDAQGLTEPAKTRLVGAGRRTARP